MTEPPSPALPRQARVIIVGGGIVGCSVAYHLGKLGWRDVLLLERDKLTSGSTHHAAGLVGQLRTSANITQLLKYSVELYDTLEQETGQATGWKRNGGLRLACNPERMIEIRRQATTAHSFGLEMHLLSPAEAQKLWPAMDVSDLVGAAFLPTDGQANPSDTTLALAKGARMNGVRIVEDCAVTALRRTDGRIAGVSTAHGDIDAEIVVLCCGQWTRKLAASLGVAVPLVSVQHQYVITEPMGLDRNLPTLRDPDRLIYFKEEVGGLVMGGYEPNPIPWAVHGVPEDFAFQLLQPDWEHFEPMMTQALARVPALEKVGIRQLINGPESFTPDGNWIIGEAQEQPGLFIGAGFNAFGIASAGGAGRALAEWIVGGEPSLDVWPVDIRRFGRPHRDVRWVRTRTLEAYGRHYTMAWPFEEPHHGRPARVSPLYLRLKEAGACFGEKLGWERPNWFAAHGMQAHDEYSYGRQNWFDTVGEEHRACRERVTLFDETSFAKLEVSGRDASRALSWICANDIDKPPGSVTYTQMLNRRGGIQCDLTVARLAEDAFYIVTGTGFATHDRAWILGNIPAGCDVRLSDVTSGWAVLGLMGPQAREVLARCTDAELDNDSFPFGTWREIEIAGATVRAVRITFVGELGWELHVPTESALAVYDRLMAEGAPWGIVNGGYRAIDSLRLEKSYRVWAGEIGPDYSPLEAGLGWAVKLNGQIPFLGREALEKQKAAPLTKRLAGFTTDPKIVLLGRETIYRDDARVGWLATGGFGYTVNRSIGFGYVRNPAGVNLDFLRSGTWELEVAAERVPAKLHLRPLHDPENKRVKA